LRDGLAAASALFTRHNVIVEDRITPKQIAEMYARLHGTRLQGIAVVTGREPTASAHLQHHLETGLLEVRLVRGGAIRR
jgi:hypothetical protein